MIKLIATDIDGTLLKDGTLMLDPEYMTVIEKLIAKGIRFVACSGRQFISERKLFAPIRDKLLYITDGGTVVRTPKEILKVHTLPEEIWHGMCETVRNELPDCDYFIATPDYCLAEDAGSRMFRWLTDSYGYDIREAADLMKTPVDNGSHSLYHPSHHEEYVLSSLPPGSPGRNLLLPEKNGWTAIPLG